MRKHSWFTPDGALFIMRIGVGAIFIFTGWTKVHNMHNTIGFFSQIGFSAFWAYVVTAVELLGGIAVLLGIFTRIAATLLVVTMIVAVWVTRTDAATMITPASLFFASLALVCGGAGKYAIVREKMPVLVETTTTTVTSVQ